MALEVAIFTVFAAMFGQRLPISVSTKYFTSYTVSIQFTIFSEKPA
jgi:hypothetical protein